MSVLLFYSCRTIFVFSKFNWSISLHLVQYIIWLHILQYFYMSQGVETTWMDSRAEVGAAYRRIEVVWFSTLKQNTVAVICDDYKLYCLMIIREWSFPTILTNLSMVFLHTIVSSNLATISIVTNVNLITTRMDGNIQLGPILSGIESSAIYTSETHWLTINDSIITDSGTKSLWGSSEMDYLLQSNQISID